MKYMLYQKVTKMHLFPRKLYIFLCAIHISKSTKAMADKAIVNYNTENILHLYTCLVGILLRR